MMHYGVEEAYTTFLFLLRVTLPDFLYEDSRP